MKFKSILLIISLFSLLTCSVKTNEKSTMKHKHTNKLAQSQSPYLLQHAHNPVNWFPWGEEAFTKAKAENKPIFLSIGYSTCHWCHVMEHESFEDSTVAVLMNEHFISIKVDREEMPEVDHLYMAVCQAMTGRGGWPLTIVMTPEKEPFFAGTYFPKDGRGQRPGMLQLLPNLARAWKDQQTEIRNSIQRISQYMLQINDSEPGAPIAVSILDKTFSQFQQRFDSEYGGFGRAPKFPSAHNLIYLLRYHQMNQDKQALTMVETTLQKMRQGGIYDHIGYGFHRYSTDKQWLLPHFEKMLYDQAMISMAYLEAYQSTKKSKYAETAKEIFAYALRDMTSPEGGFYSAEDADSDGEEGKYYVWTRDEILNILGKKDGELFSSIFNISEQGNFTDEASGHASNNNIPHFSQAKYEIAKTLNITQSELDNFIQKARGKLLSIRVKRIHPLKDDKVLTDWNGLMIASLSLGGQILDEPKYLRAAEKSAHFVLDELKDKNGRLKKRWRQGEAGLPSFLDDYSFMIWGLLNLYEATFDILWLDEAIQLAEIMVSDFYDSENGGFFLGSKNAEKLFVRTKDTYDGAIPAGNSVALMNCQRLGRFTGDVKWLDIVEKSYRAISTPLSKSPMGNTYLLTSFLFEDQSPKEILIVGDESARNQILQEFSKMYLPNKVILFKNASNKDALSKIAPWTKNQEMINGETTYYICENFACQLPTNDFPTVKRLLNSKP
jgi:uncharacterized protein YyaL (SSP411 family)